MRTKEDIEHYMLRMDLQYEEIGEEAWIIHDEEDTVDNIVAMYRPPILVLRVKLMEAPKKRREELFEKLLGLNAEMLHGAFALEGDNVVVVDTLEMENLDYNEFQASFDSLTMAITDYYPLLSEYRDKGEVKDPEADATE